MQLTNEQFNNTKTVLKNNPPKVPLSKSPLTEVINIHLNMSAKNVIDLLADYPKRSYTTRMVTSGITIKTIDDNTVSLEIMPAVNMEQMPSNVIEVSGDETFNEAIVKNMLSGKNDRNSHYLVMRVGLALHELSLRK